ncbi:MAG: HAD family hydrolase [Culicoidibacterales bacterium]
MLINGKEFKTILFDKDGTVFDSEKFRIELRLDYAQHHKFPLTREMLLDCIGKSCGEYVNMIQERLGEDYDFPAFENELIEYETIVESKKSVPLREGANVFIESVFNAGVTLGMVTSSFHENALSSLQKHKLDTYFSIIIGVDDIQKPKPDPQPYLTAMKQLGALAEETIAFEDSPSGVASALAAGIDVVYIKDLVDLPLSIQNKVFLSIEGWDEMEQFLSL